MFMILKKKTILVIVSFIALFSAGALSRNFVVRDDVATNTSPEKYESIGRAEMVSAEQKDYFAETKAKRKADREVAVSLLNDTVNNTGASAEARKQASDKIAIIADNIIKESAIEDLLKAKGYEKAVVYISESGINAAVSAGSLTDEDVSKIKDIILSQTNNNNIKIVAVP